jgi:hypothetical protein
MKILLDFKRLPIAELLLFILNVIKKMKDNSKYEAESSRLKAVEASYDLLVVATTEADKGGAVKKDARDIQRGKTLKEMDMLVQLMELHTEAAETFFLEAGFQLRKTPTRQDGPLEKPIFNYVRQGVLSGTIDGAVKNYPVSATQLALRYSEDKGLTWVNGTYAAGKRFSMVGLPIRKDVLVSACYHGTHQRMSDWSDPVSVFVL